MERGAPVVDRLHLEAFVPEGDGDGLTDRRLVLDDQNAMAGRRLHALIVPNRTGGCHVSRRQPFVRLPSVGVSVWSEPSRLTVIFTESPGLCDRIALAERGAVGDRDPVDRGDDIARFHTRLVGRAARHDRQHGGAEVVARVVLRAHAEKPLSGYAAAAQ